MEARIYSKDLLFFGVIENFTSLIWTRKYFKPGNFELYAPLTDSNVQLLQPGNLISKRGAKEAGVIEDLTFEEHNDAKIAAKGRFLSCYFERRIIKQTMNIDATVTQAVVQLAQAANIDFEHMGDWDFFETEEKVKFQVSWKNFLDVLEKISLATNIAFRLRPDFEAKQIRFDMYTGVDRSKNQKDRPRIIFSEEFNNLESARYSYNDQSLKTFFYIGGQGEGPNRTIVTVGENSMGIDRREMFINASDINPSDISTDEYKKLLKQRGEEQRLKNGIAKSFEGETTATANNRYKIDYDLGDIVTIQKESWNMAIDMRITELQEVYEDGDFKVYPTFGSPLPETVNWEELNG